jgi:hypothetical protein
MEKTRNAFKVSVCKPEGKRPLVKHGHKWRDNTKMYLKSRRQGVWIRLLWLRIWFTDEILQR